MKTINNTDISIKDIDKEVTLYGWVQKKRNLGGVLFIDLRDRSGLIQLVLNDDNEFFQKAETLKNESVIITSTSTGLTKAMAKPEINTMVRLAIMFCPLMQYP